VSRRKSVQTLEQAIAQLAQQEADAVLAEANAKAANIHQAAQSKTEAECARIMEEAQREVAEHLEQASARAQLEAQMLRLERREQAIGYVFDLVDDHLPWIPQKENYVDIVRHLLDEAMTHLGGRAFVVCADPQTHDILNTATLAALADELDIALELGSPLDKGTGIVVATPDGHRRYDNTFETRLVRMQDVLRAAVYHILAEDD
jgi:vacuolar-type H+-ATPase subunit E/Vma4